jgi:hypothetical protein
VTPTTSLRISESILSRARVQAVKQRLTLARWLVFAIEDAVEAAEGKTGAQHQARVPVTEMLMGDRQDHPDITPKATNGSAPPVPPPAIRPIRSKDPPSDVRVSVVIAAINAEVRCEQQRALGGIIQRDLRRILKIEPFTDVADLGSARAKDPDAWIAADAGPGLIGVLFPNNRDIVARAVTRKNRVMMDLRLARYGTELQKFGASVGISGRAAVNLRNTLQHFPGMSIEEAVRQGPAAWLDAEVSEDVARKLFDERTAMEARRRGNARSMAKKKIAAGLAIKPSPKNVKDRGQATN